MFCKKCGKQIDDDTIYCPSCGTKQSGSISESIVENQQETTIVQNQNSSTIQELTRQADIAYLEQLRMAEYGCSMLADQINKMDNQINSLGYYNNYKKPSSPNYSKDDSGCLPIIGIVVSGLILILFIAATIHDGDMPGWGAFMFLIMTVVFITCWYYLFTGKKQYKEHIKQMEYEYQTDLSDYEKNKAKDETRVKIELNKKKDLTVSRNQLYTEWEKANQIKVALYDFNIIPKQMREIHNSVYYLYDYISTSRETLSKAFDHLHLEQIIITQKELLRQNQEILSSLDALWISLEDSINKNNKHYDNIISGLKSTNQNLYEISQCEKTRQASLDNLEFYARMNYWKDIFK